jgi:SAM-dependent methyltransferase
MRSRFDKLSTNGFPFALSKRAAPQSQGERRSAMDRHLEPEWLDHLPATDVRAVRARRDLRLVNRIMGHAGIIAKALRALPATGTPRIAELGAGDGTLLLRIADAISWPRTDVVLIDRQPAVSAETSAQYRQLGWHAAIEAADVFDWLARQSEPFDAIVANLFLHHFERDELRKLFALAAARTRCFIACEPRRARFSLAGSRMLGLIACNDVTRHDAVLSVRAGFLGRELSALWPADHWTTEESGAGLFSHLFVARRDD